MTIADKIRATCAEYFGQYRANTGRWSPPNRCDQCPLRAPCVKQGNTPARTHAELDEARDVFVRECAEVLA